MVSQPDRVAYLDSIVGHLPPGDVWRSGQVEGTNLRALLDGLTPTVRRADLGIRTLVAEIVPSETTLLIAEWERAVGIPDGCFTTDGTIEQRRRNVVVKLAALGIQTQQDFIDLAARFGIVVTVVGGMDVRFDPLFELDEPFPASDLTFDDDAGGDTIVRNDGGSFIDDGWSDFSDFQCAVTVINADNPTNDIVAQQIVAVSATTLTLLPAAGLADDANDTTAQLSGSHKQARHTIVVRYAAPDANQFPLEFPAPFGGAELATLECLFQRLKPANCDLIFRSEE